ncbi:hypothetical protein MUP79_10120 [Candidatus Bathyarchaeota archaeon]|nr:hypothetical protein [Candidatus Bathyarchaeota archaeon]
MSKTEWRRWAQENPAPKGRSETKQEKNRRGKRRYDLRRRARTAIEDLIIVMDQLPKMSEHPERDYAMIFNDGEHLWAMIEACSKAYEKKSAAHLAIGLYTAEDRDHLQTALGRAGLGYWSKSRLSDKRERMEAVVQLRRREVEDGVRYYEEVMKDWRVQQEQREPTEIIVERNVMLLALWQEMRREDRLSKALEKGA